MPKDVNKTQETDIYKRPIHDIEKLRSIAMRIVFEAGSSPDASRRPKIKPKRMYGTYSGQLKLPWQRAHLPIKEFAYVMGNGCGHKK